MKLDSIAAIAEITKYYGELDDVYRFMKRLNRKTNQMWDSTCSELSMIIERKEVFIKDKSLSWIIRTFSKCPLILELFHSKILEICNENEYKCIIRLFSDFKYPKMIRTLFECNTEELDLTLSNYRDKINDSCFSNIHLYKKVVEIAIEREIKLTMIVSYIFIHEVLELENVQYIHTIIFPCNEENKAETMIKLWRDFYNSKKFDYNEVKLVWDGMNLENFLSIYSIFLNKNITVKIIANKNLQYLAQFLDKICYIQKSKTSIKIADSNELILWSLFRSVNKIMISKCYYKPNAISEYAIELLNTNVKMLPEKIISKSSKVSIKHEEFSFLKFDFIPIKITNNGILKQVKLISFDNNEISFNSNNINYCESIQSESENEILIFNRKVTLSSDFKICFEYSYKEDQFKFRISNKQLSKTDIDNFMKEISDLGFIYFVSVVADDPSSALAFLNNCRKIPCLKSIELKIEQKCDAIQSIEINDIVKEILNQGKRVKIIRPMNKTRNYVSLK